MADGVVVCDRHGTIVYASEGLAVLLGYRPDELVSQPLETIVPDRLAARHEGLRREYVESPATRSMGVGLELAARHRCGRVVPVEVGLSSFGAGSEMRVVAVVRDVSERRRSEAARRRLERDLLQARKMEALGRLARGVAHDFNNILQAVGGTAALALEHADGRLREDLETIVASAAQGRELTSQLLMFGRPDAGAPELLDLQRELAELLPVLRRFVPKRVEVRIECPPDVAGVCVSRVHLEQILMNLVVNAGEAIEGDGEVTVRVADTRARLRPDSLPSVEEEAVEIAVVDTGPGMSEDTLACLFDPFYTTKPGGTGIGLSIVYELVSQAGGRISARSLAPAGAELLVLLPAFRPPHPSAPCPGV
ncbi:PAS domain S-box protein [Gaiella occulta]|uniref:histidine kinase n=2 Tax=Gaiella occulta TaxID=1002870 RepID=A0A7M2Z140_9ACTN|nr:PAS domain S-box protein [Gaiella occulta]